MPVIPQPLPRGSYPQYFESSGMRSQRDSDATGKQWLRNNTMANQDMQVRNSLSALNRAIQRQRPRVLGMPMLAAIVLKDFVMVSDAGDYYNCYTYDGKTTGTNIVKVAKNQDIRCGVGAWPSKTIRGITYTYTYVATAGTTADGVNVIEYVRSVSGSDSSSETDYITPCLNVGDIITGFETYFNGPSSLTAVTWQALADGRAWTAL